MIDLLSVKLNNEYDYIQAALPNSDGSWLCTETSENYTQGYSYEVLNGVATRIEIKEDYLIENAILPTTEMVCIYLNNYLMGLNRCSCDCEDALRLKAISCENKIEVDFETIPASLAAIISKMIAYDVFFRGVPSELQSEHVGNYSYTKADYEIGALSYPGEIVSGLYSYKRVGFI